MSAVSTISDDDLRRAEAKSAREQERQQQWSKKDDPLSKSELRNQYKGMKSKPKGQKPCKDSRQFADL